MDERGRKGSEITLSMVSRKVDPLSKTDSPLLPIIQVLVQALF